jgi:hypothetical protein
VWLVATSLPPRWALGGTHELRMLRLEVLELPYERVVRLVAIVPRSRSAAPQLACLARDFLLSGTHRFLRRTPLGVFLSRAAAVPRIGDRLSTLLPLARAARDAGLGVLPGDLLRASLRPLRRCLTAPPRSFGSRLRHPVPSLTEDDASVRSRREQSLLGRFPGAGGRRTPDPLDLDGARPAWAVSTRAPRPPGRSLGSSEDGSRAGPLPAPRVRRRSKRGSRQRIISRGWILSLLLTRACEAGPPGIPASRDALEIPRLSPGADPLAGRSPSTPVPRQNSSVSVEDGRWFWREARECQRIGQGWEAGQSGVAVRRAHEETRTVGWRAAWRKEGPGRGELVGRAQAARRI